MFQIKLHHPKGYATRFFLQPFITQQDLESLQASVIPQEIKDAFQINRLKVPGSDGFGGKFYQAYLPITG